jgi:Flp pilus assembly protein TadD
MRRLPLFVPTMISLLLLGSVECGAQSATSETSSAWTLTANTPVILRLKENLYKEDAKPGQPLEFEVVEDVVANGQVTIQSGATASGSIREINKAAKGPAKLLIDLGSVQTITGEMVRLSSPGTAKDNASRGDKPGLKDVPGLVSFAPEILPALPVIVPVLAVMELFPGKKVLLHKDASVVARVAENVTLDPAKLKSEPEPGPSSEVLKGGLVFLRLLLMPDPRANERIRSLVFSGKRLRKAGDLDGAIEEYQQALALGADSWDVHFSLAQLFEEKRDFVHALPEYQIAATLRPGSEYGRERFASLLVESGEPDVAIAEIKEVMRMWPNNIFFHYLMGKVLVKKNDPDGAIAELQWALKQWRNHSWQTNCELGSAYELKGDLKAALDQYRTAYRVHMDDKECRAAYERLHSQLKK